jgi:serralysin
MTTYNFSSLTNGQAIAFNPEVDYLVFDSTLYLTNELIINQTASGLSLSYSQLIGPPLLPAKTIVLTGMTLGLVTGGPFGSAAAHIQFANGGMLLIGDNSTVAPSADELSNSLIGGSFNDMLFGLGGNDSLDGRGGSDVMVGGDGNDTYVVDNNGDQVIETSSTLGGVDTVQTTISYTLSNNVENLQLLTAASINGTGNTLANTLTGNSGKNILDGRGGADTMSGGDGNDTYIVDNTGDVVIEKIRLVSGIDKGGVDTVQSSISYTLRANVENLQLLPSITSINGTGNTLANALTGNSGNNILDGKGGADTITGGDGDDTYVVDDAGDSVIESNTTFTQIDTVQSFINDYTLTANVEILELMGYADLNGSGNAIDNIVYVNSGNNVVNGGTNYAAVDNPVAYLYGTLLGGITLIGQAKGAGDTVSYQGGAMSGVIVSLATVGPQETEGSGSDTLINFENLVGSEYADELTGDARDNVLVGGYNGEADILTGGDGNDTYVITGSEIVVETNASTAQRDTVLSLVNYRLGANVENLTLMDITTDIANGTKVFANLQGTGNALNNVLKGNGGNNLLDGRSGADSMSGGNGDDTYVVDNLADTVTETSLTGIDTVKSFINYTLGANVENLQLMGTASLEGTGNALANTVWANRGANRLDGQGGIDTLSYIFGANAGVTVSLGILTAQETGGSGSDTLSNFENLTGSSYGDTLSGNAGSNVLNGGLGIDTVSYASATASVNVNLSISTAQNTGGGGTDTLLSFENVTGSNFNDKLIGNSGNNVFNGGSGGLDTVSYEYIVAASGLSPVGVIVDLSVTTAQNTGASGFDTLIGIENLTGSALVDTLTGNAGDNLLDGGAGADILTGGDGNDTYIVDDVGDELVETSTALSQIDSVRSSVSYILAANLENLLLTGTASLNGTGNSLANALTGNTGNNILDGQGGIDTMTGGDGNDTYVVDNASDKVIETNASLTQIDTVQSSVSYTLPTSVERLQLMGSSHINGTGNNSDNLLYSNQGNNVLQGGLGSDTVSYEFITSGPVTVGLHLSTLQNTVNAGSDTLLDIENLIGTAFADKLTGNAGNNRLDGKAGADTLTGGDGNDTYIVDDVGDQVVETGTALSQIDSVQASVSYILAANVENLSLTGSAPLNGTGNSLANTLTGNSGSNLLDGKGGADTMTGGDGNDTYVVDNASDKVIEINASLTQIDSVQSSVSHILASNVENLQLTGSSAINATGNALANTLIGNAGDNILNGLGGIDTMTGGDGNDIYTVDKVGDQVIETNASLSQIDTVESSITYTLGANVENLKLTGTAAINGAGNALDNVISGNAYSNVLDGGTGLDTVSYLFGTTNIGVKVNLGLTTAQITGGSGTDTLSNFENLIGSSYDDDLTGSSIANSISGALGNDRLAGGLGNDSLTGGSGADIIRFDSLLGALNIDTITDYNVLDDTIELENSIFTKLAAGALNPASFQVGAAAAANDYVLYNSATGALSYDADGKGAGAAVQFALLIGAPVLTSLDFVVT